MPIELIQEESQTVLIQQVQEKDIYRLFTEPGALNPLLQAVEERVAAFEPNLATATSRKEIASLAYKVARTKTYLDDMGKTLVASLKDLPRQIDANRKAMRDRLDQIAAKARASLTAWEEEQARITARLQAMRQVPASHLEMTVEGFNARIEALKAEVISSSWGEHEEAAEKAREEALEILWDLRDKRIEHDEEQEELARLRQEAAERKRKDDEERIRAEAAEKARIQAEADARARIEAAERAEREAQDRAQQAERERAASEERALQAEAQAAERARIQQEEAEARKREEAARREADAQHRANVESEALQDILGTTTLDADQGRHLLALVANGAIRHMSLHY